MFRTARSSNNPRDRKATATPQNHPTVHQMVKVYRQTPNQRKSAHGLKVTEEVSPLVWAPIVPDMC
eukprot:1748543-Amphidinium_carterae.1